MMGSEVETLAAIVLEVKRGPGVTIGVLRHWSTTNNQVLLPPCFSAGTILTDVS